MKLVAKYSSPLISLGELPNEADGLLRRYWLDEIEEQEQAKIVELLQNLHKRGVWIECGCCQDSNGEGPVMLFFRRKDGFHGMRRMTTRINHDQACPFHWDQLERRNREGTPDYLIFKAPHTAAPNTSTVVPFRKPNKGTTGSANRLQNLLFWLINKAGLNRLDGGSVQSEDRVKRLVEAAKRVPLPDTDLMLHQILWTLPDAYIKRWAHADLYKLQDRGHWPENVPLQGYLIIPVKSVEGKILVTSGDRRIEIHGQLVHEGEKECFPRMAIVALRHSALGIQAEEAFTIPVRYYAHLRKEAGEVRHYFDLMPVGSERERSVADELAAITRWKSGQGPNGEGVVARRPIIKDDPKANFIVEAGGAKAYVLLDGENQQWGASTSEMRDELREILGKQDRIFVLQQDEGVEKLKGQLIGWIKAELGYA